MQSYQEGIAECELAEELGFDWVSLSEHYYSGNRTTPNPAVMAAAVAERCRRVRIALLGHLLPLNNPIRAAEEIGMLDNLTGGRMVVAFMRGTLSEDQVYGVNPAEGRDRLMRV
jgi:alkanesulfonate monooxygenase SsuD/methylene tetrahydromethanopterin reductase-like flavin-dependent oxidoreductase (luciferase family)